MKSNTRATIKCYFDAADFLGKSETKPVGNNTVMFKDSNVIVIKHFNTNIIYYGSDDTIELYNGGFFSSTTKKRINMFTPFSIFSKNGEWYIRTEDGIFKFKDGIKFSSRGICTQSDKYKVSDRVM